MKFQLTSSFQPTGDQPAAITQLVNGFKKKYRDQTLLGVTGSGKTFVMANVIAQLQRPTLIISHNKTLAAQLATEFRQFFPHNAVHYFVSYYDYYLPESYIPQSDTYIEKKTARNEEIERLRHASTQSLLSRRDVIIVASVSCIYGLGSPVEYQREHLSLAVGRAANRQDVIRQLVAIQYQRNEQNFWRGSFRLKGDTLEIFPVFSEHAAYRVEFHGDMIEAISEIDFIDGRVVQKLNEITIFPATHYLAPKNELKPIIAEIERDLAIQLKEFESEGKLVEAQRLKQRVTYDLEMIQTVGYVNGIENYSRYFERRRPGDPSYTLLDYFPKDYLMFVDESHITLPQIDGMHKGDRARKQNLVDYGFRLPATLDNRPLTFMEFDKHINQVTYVSATPRAYEKKKAKQVVELLIRPTGLLDPEVEVRKTDGQIADLLEEIRKRTAQKQRVLVTVLTKRLAEELTDYLKELKVKVQYLHSEIDTMERLEILRDLRLGVYDVVVGINLLREGLDLPEVSLVAIIDADKESYLRDQNSLIQTIGRAARHIDGKVIMYADRVSDSMKVAIGETDRRRERQRAYNDEHGITPQSIQKAIMDDRLAGAKQETEFADIAHEARNLPKDELKHIIDDLTSQMTLAAENLEFERAALLRDQITELRKTKHTKRKSGR